MNIQSLCNQVVFFFFCIEELGPQETFAVKIIAPPFIYVV